MTNPPPTHRSKIHSYKTGYPSEEVNILHFWGETCMREGAKVLLFQPAFLCLFSAVKLTWRMWRRLPLEPSRPPLSMPTRSMSGPLNKSKAEVILCQFPILKVNNKLLPSELVRYFFFRVISVWLDLSNCDIGLGILWNGMVQYGWKLKYVSNLEPKKIIIFECKGLFGVINVGG